MTKKTDLSGSSNGNNIIEEVQLEEEEADEKRVSRLFYLQLLSSLFNPSSAVNKSGQKRSKREARNGHVNNNNNNNKPEDTSSHPRVVASVSWMDVTNLLSRQSSANRSQRERDLGDSLYPSERMSFRQMGTFTRGGSKDLGSRNIGQRRIEPILNTRMRELSNFTLAHRESEQNKVVAQKSYQCRTRTVLLSTIYISLAASAIALSLLLLLTTPAPLGPSYETVYLRDADPAARPRVGLCLPAPFSLRRLAENNVSAQLASFLLYSLSPFLPNQDILDDQDLLADLTNQFRSLVSRVKRGGGGNHRLKKLLRGLAPKCHEVITACQIGSGRLLPGDACCRSIFTAAEYSLRGLCFIAADFAKMSAEPDFPARAPGSAARLTVVLNASAAAEVGLDPAVIPWSARRPPLTLVVSNQGEMTWSDDGVGVLRGQTLSVEMRKRGVDSAFPGSSIVGGCSPAVENSRELFGGASHASCTDAAVQMIAEKSVNCSVMSLPRISRSLPFCEPLEGLGLMYVLREQGSLVATDGEMLARFEAGVAGRCERGCEFSYFETAVATAEANGHKAGENRVARL